MALPIAPVSFRRTSSSLVHRLRRHPDKIVITLTLALVVGVATVLSPPPKIPPLKIVNRSALTVSIEVRPAQQPGWLDIGAFGPGRTSVAEVIDQGSAWLVLVSAGSHATAPFAVSRDQLRAQRWTLTIPNGPLESLRRQGVVPRP